MFSILSKSVNALKAGLSYAASTSTGDIAGRWMPLFAGIELTNICNLKCPECTSGAGMMTRPAGFMKRELFERIIGELRPYLLNINLYFQGEPMLHPEFHDFVNLAGDIPVTVSTNGHYLTGENARRIARSGISKLIVSLDGMDQESYSKYRINGDFSKVADGISLVSRELRNAGSSVKMEIQFLVNRHNQHQIDDVKRFAEEAGAAVRLKSMQLISSSDTSEWLPGIEKYRRYRVINGKKTIKGSLSNRCLRLWTNPVITWDGRVVPCCFDKNADHEMGNLNEQTFKEIWNGAKYREFRRSVLTDRKEIEICTNCTSGLKNINI